MKKLLALALICAAIVTAQAQKGLTDEQKATKAELITKYDTNKDGKLDKTEIAAMTDEDKAKWKALRPHHKKADADSSTNSVSTNSVDTSTNSVK